jgi:hypothetical protein
MSEGEGCRGIKGDGTLGLGDGHAGESAWLAAVGAWARR